MPLHHLLYRCPECGHDPVRPSESGAVCPECDARFVRGTGARIQISARTGKRSASAGELIDAIDGWDERVPTVLDEDGNLDYGAHIHYRRAVGQGVALVGDQVAGFYEEFTDRTGGNIHANEEGLTLRDDTGDVLAWGWEDLRAVQTSSRSLQINVHPEGLFDLTFESDSPRRWENLMHRALRNHYRARGLEVMEFQPRVVTRRTK